MLRHWVGWVFLFVSIVASAHSVPVTWQQGRLWISESGVPEIHISENDPLPLVIRNLKIKVSENKRNTSIQLVLPRLEGAEVENLQQIVQVYGELRPGAYVPNLVLGMNRVESGDSQIYWFYSGKEYEMSPILQAGVLMIRPIDRVAGSEIWHGIAIGNPARVVSSEYCVRPQELAVAQGPDGKGDLIGYDPQTRFLIRVPFGPTGNRNSYALFDGNEKFIPLPGASRSHLSFSEIGTLAANPSDYYLDLKLKSGEGESPQAYRIYLKDFVQGTSTDFNMDGLVAARVPVWATGRDSIQHLLGSGPSNRVASPFSPTFDKWITAGVQEGFRRSAGRKRRVRVLVAAISQIALDGDPRIRNQLIHSVLDLTRNEAQLGSAPVVYVRVPSRAQTSDLRRFGKIYGHQLREQLKGNERDVPFLILDMISNQPGNQEDLIFATIEEAQSEMPPDVPLNVVILRTLQGQKTDNGLDRYGPQLHDGNSFGRNDLEYRMQVQTMDQFLDRDVRIDFLRKDLEKEGFPLTRESLTRVIREVKERQTESSSGILDPLDDLEYTSFFLAVGLERLTSENLDDEAKLVRAAEAYLTLAGRRSNAPFPTDVVQRARAIVRLLSSSSAVRSNRALVGRERELEAIQRQLVTWLAYGRLESPYLALTLLGDTGTGKTHTAEAIVDLIGAAKATVNFSVKQDDVLEEIKRQVSALKLDPNPVKVLILDEVHSNSKAMLELLPAFGNADRKASRRAINFDGIIVLSLMNVSKEAAAYQKLSAKGVETEDYPKEVFNLFVESISKTEGQNAAVDTKVAGALAGRLLGGMVFFTPVAQDEKQQSSLVDRLLEEYEGREKVRLVVLDQARKKLKEVGASYTEGNYRSAESAIRQEIMSAIGTYLAANPGLKLEGQHFILTTEKVGNQNAERPVIIPVSDDARGAVLMIEDSLRRFRGGIESALKYSIDTLEDQAISTDDESARRMHLTNAQGLRRLLEAYLRASAQPAFGKDRDASRKLIDQLVFPSLLEESKKIRFNQVIEGNIRDLFSKFSEKVSPEELGEDSGKAWSVLKALMRLEQLEMRAPVEERGFFRWVNRILEMDRWNQQSAQFEDALGLEVSTLEEIMKEWSELQQAIKTEALEQVRMKKVVTQMLAFQDRVKELTKTNTGVNKKILDGFLEKLIQGDSKAAEEILKAQKEALEKKKAGVSAAAPRRVEFLGPGAIEIAAGYLLDDIVRRLADVELSNLRARERETSFHRERSQNAAKALPMSPQCENLMLKAREASEELRRIFEK